VYLIWIIIYNCQHELTGNAGKVGAAASVAMGTDKDALPSEWGSGNSFTGVEFNPSYVCRPGYKTGSATPELQMFIYAHALQCSPNADRT